MSDFATDLHRTAKVLSGEDLGSWRPKDTHLRAFVEAALLSVERLGFVDARLVLEGLREVDPEHPWGAHYAYLLDRYDDIEADARRLIPLTHVAAAGEAWTRWQMDLEQRTYEIVCELEEWREAERALARMLRAVKVAQ